MATARIDTLSAIPEEDPNKTLLDAAMKIINESGTVPQQPGFGDIIKSFRPSQGGGFGKGITKIGEYLNSPEGQQIIGGLISRDKPYGGAYMVDKAQDQIRQQNAFRISQNAPLSKGDRLKALIDLGKNQPEIIKAIAALKESGARVPLMQSETEKNKAEAAATPQKLELEKQMQAITAKKNELDYEASLRKLTDDEAKERQDLDIKQAELNQQAEVESKKHWFTSVKPTQIGKPSGRFTVTHVPKG
jgi:hypothetical protein